MKNIRLKISKIYKHIPIKTFFKSALNYILMIIRIFAFDCWIYLLLGQLQKEKQQGVGIRNQVYDSSLGDEDKLHNGEASLVIQS